MVPAEPLNIFDSSYASMKDTMFAAERKMLKSLGFHVFVEHPHRYILAFVKILNCHTNRPLVQRSWNYCNDAARTTLCAQYRPYVIAATAIYLAARTLSVALPNDWWTLCEASREQLEDGALQILLLYEQGKCYYTELTPPRKSDQPETKRAKQ